MRSYPLIQDSLTKTQQQFVCFVERHVGDRDALYESDGDGSLPGDTVRMQVKATPAADDLIEQRHVVEFMSLGRDGHWEAVGCIGHSMKEVEALQGRHELESTFEIEGPDIPHGSFLHADVERTVQSVVDRLTSARLLPLRSHQAHAVPELCAA